MAQGIFITGTDTEIGKTRFATQLVRALAAEGERVAVMKPVASGARRVGGQWRNDDALALLAAAGQDQGYESCNPYCFEPPIAPHLAARQAGVHIDLDRIVSHAQTLQASDWLIVEGVGGWRVPLDDHHDVAALARRLAMPVILVVGVRLGCINHALLTAQAIIDDGLPLLGWVANHVDPATQQAGDVVAAITERLAAPLLYEMAHGNEGVSPEPLRRRLASTA